MARQDTLEKLLDLLAGDLVKRIQDGSATAADLNVARQLLKDNSINAVPTKSNDIGKLADSLPFNQSPEDIEAEEPFH